MRTAATRASVVLAILLLTGTAAHAQSNVSVFGTIGGGSLGDDEGSLGSGLVAGGGVGWWVTERLVIEGAATRAHHERLGSLSWQGDPVVVSARVLYHAGGASSRVRYFGGGGIGYFRYPGTFTETVFDAPNTPPRTVAADWLVHGAAVEGGTGVSIAIGGRAFVRPEAWLTIARPSRIRPAPEPPYFMPRLGVTGGVRF
jgi:hypothetical protein